ncbi:MAG: hypothetical protein IPM43_09565 [Actinomycetota bacterium]|nr:MAG: hypothetical protein IPM43_09565 [Actinomycetota bacterium]
MLVVVSCGGDGESDLDTSGEHRAEVEADFRPDINTSIVDSVLYGQSSGAFELELAGYNLMSYCVQTAGFDWPAVKPTEALILADVKPIVRLLSVEGARSKGYGFADLTPAVQMGDPVGDYRSSLAPAQIQAFDTLVSTCSEDTRGALFADTRQYEDLRQQLEQKRLDFYTAFESLDSIEALTRDWSDCMKSAGYQVDTLSDAVNLASSTEGPGIQGISVTPTREFAIALADADCRVKTDYEAIYIDEFRNAESSFVYENEGLIVSLIQLRYGRSEGDAS